jgi:ribokinase
VQFAHVTHVPRAGEVMHARDPFEEPAGGGAVVAVQLARLAGESLFITALGDDEPGRRSPPRLGELGVRVGAAARAANSRRAVTLVDDERERTITTFGDRLEPLGADEALPWARLAEMDAVYFTAGDLDALRAARAARVLVATPRALEALAAAAVQLDVLVRSATDPGEAYEPGMLDPAPRFVVSTRGEHGGAWTGETSGSWEATPLPGPPVDAYGCGDSFAAALTFGLGAGMQMPAAIDLAARSGAACLCGRGPYAGQFEPGST